MDLLEKKVKVKRKGAVHRRRVTVDSAELPRRTPSFTTEDKSSNLSVEAVGLEPAEVVEKRSRVSSIKSMFLERRKTNLGFNSALLPEKVDRSCQTLKTQILSLFFRIMNAVFSSSLYVGIYNERFVHFAAALKSVNVFSLHLKTKLSRFLL